MSLVAHLRDDARLPGQRHQQVDLAERLRDRLLHIDVLAVPHRMDSDGKVRVIRRGDDRGVEGRARLVEHLPEIAEEGHGGKQLARLLRVRPVQIDVAERGHADEVRRGEGLDQVVAAIADADNAEAKRPVGGRKAGRLAECRAGDD